MKTETSVKSKDEEIKTPFMIKVIWMVFVLILLLNIVQGIRNFMAMRYGWSLLNFVFCLIYFFILRGTYMNTKQKLKDAA